MYTQEQQQELKTLTRHTGWFTEWTDKYFNEVWSMTEGERDNEFDGDMYPYEEFRIELTKYCIQLCLFKHAEKNLDQAITTLGKFLAEEDATDPLYNCLSGVLCNYKSFELFLEELEAKK